MGALWPARVSGNVNHGAESMLRAVDPTRYWTEIRRFIEEAIQDDQVDHLMLLGSHASSHDLLEIFHGLVNPRISFDAWQNYLVRIARAGRRENVLAEELFAATRVAARAARLGSEDQI